MGAELAVKKRGRPKKTEQATPSSTNTSSDVSDIPTSKQRSKARSFSTTEVAMKDSTAKTTRKRRLVAMTEDDEVIASKDKVKGTTKSRSKLGQRNSPADFEEISETPSVTMNESSSRASTLPRGEEAVNPEPVINEGTKSVGISKSTSTKSIPSKSSKSVFTEISSEADALPSVTTIDQVYSQIDATGPAPEPQTSLKRVPPTNIAISDPQQMSSIPYRSSFLDSFLASTPDPSPSTLASESSKISDRSAFNTAKPSINDILSGAGVSDLSSFPDPKPSTKTVRESAIPISVPKTFKPHGLSAFPDKEEKQKQSISQQVSKALARQIDPTTYGAGSFSSFRSSQPLAAPKSTMAPSQSQLQSQAQAQEISVVRESPTATSPTSSIPAQPSTSSEPAQSTPPASESELAQHHLQHKQQLQQQQQQQQQTPAPSSTRSIPPTSTVAKPSTRPFPPVAPAAPLPPKRPTQMSQAELLRNTQFRSLRRKYTGLIIGIPVLVVTSWVLWKRAEEGDRGGDGVFAGLFGDGSSNNVARRAEEEVAQERTRGRGELPRRILDDGALASGKDTGRGDR